MREIMWEQEQHITIAKGDWQQIRSLMSDYQNALKEKWDYIEGIGKEYLSPYQKAEAEIRAVKMRTKVKTIDAQIYFLMFGGKDAAPVYEAVKVTAKSNVIITEKFKMPLGFGLVKKRKAMPQVRKRDAKFSYRRLIGFEVGEARFFPVFSYLIGPGFDAYKIKISRAHKFSRNKQVIDGIKGTLVTRIK